MCILAEQSVDLEEIYKEPITCFIKNINEHIKNLKGTATNIEQRAASILIEDLILHYPNHSQCTVTRSTATKTYYAQTVTLQDALDEFEMFDAYVKESYKNASDRVPQIYEEKMRLINEQYTAIKDVINRCKMPTDQRFCEILDFILSKGEEQSSKFFELVMKGFKDLIGEVASDYFDLYLLDQLLSAPDGQTTIVLAGAAHCRFLLGEILGCLQANGTFCCGLDKNRKETIQPLTQEDIVQLIAHC